MKNYYLQAYICSLLLLVFYTSCNGQIKTNLSTGSVNAPKTISAGQPKLIRTQGTSQFDQVRCALLDKAGNLWFGTTGEGVYRYDARLPDGHGKRFTQFTVKDGLSNNTVWSLLEDQSGNIWFGTDSGLCRYDSKTIVSIPISVASSSNFYRDHSSNHNPSARYAVWSMLQDKGGKIWFGTSEGIYCYYGTLFTRFLDDVRIINKSGLQLKTVGCILEDKTGNIWFCSGMPAGTEGICFYDGKSLTGFKPNGDGWIRTVLEDKNGNLCFATRHNGVCRYDPASGRFTNFTEQAGINNSSVTTIFEDKAGNLWVATELGSGELGEDGGLWRFDASLPGGHGKSFTKFTTKDGLIHNGVWCIVEDKSGNIWIGTRNMGLCRYDPRLPDGQGKNFTGFSE